MQNTGFGVSEYSFVIPEVGMSVKVHQKLLKGHQGQDMWQLVATVIFQACQSPIIGHMT